MKKLINVLLIVMAVVMVLPTVTAAATPYATYTYSAGGQVLKRGLLNILKKL